MNIYRDVLVHKGKYLNFMMSEYIKKNGEKSVWEWTTRDGVDSVVIAAVTEALGKPHLLVIEEERVPIKGNEVGLPAGLLDGNETVGQCAERELHQETGLTIDDVWYCSPFLYNSAGMSDEKSAMAFVHATGELSTKHLEDSENIKPHLFDRKRIAMTLKMADMKKIKLGFKAWFVFQFFLLGVFEDYSLLNYRTIGG